MPRIKISVPSTILVISYLLLGQLSTAYAQGVFPEVLISIDGSSDTQVGRTSSTVVQKIAVQYTPEVNQYVCDIEQEVKQDGSPTDNLNLEIWRGESPENGTLITTSVVPGSSFSTTVPAFKRFPIDNCIFHSAGKSYFYVFKRDTLDNDNFYIITKQNVNVEDKTRGWHFIPANGGWSTGIAPAPEDIDWSIKLFSFEGGGDQGGSFFETPTSTTTQQTTTCDSSDSGFFSNSFCNISLFLFVPNENVIHQFNDLLDLIKSKPPIGYFDLIKEEFGKISTATPAIFVLGGAEDLKDSFFTPIRDIIGLAILFLGGVWLFNRIRHFDDI